MFLYSEIDSSMLLTFIFFSYENPEMALHYGAMLRECIRHQIVAK